MKVLLTGVTGRVGRNVAAALIARGDTVRGIILPDDPGIERARATGVESHIGNLRDASIVAAAIDGVDAVIHLGAMMLFGSAEHDPVLFEDNLRGTFNLTHAAAMKGVSRFLFASSDEVYPSLKARYLPIDENHPTLPYSFYGLTKQAGEQTLHYYHRAHNLPISIARFALVAEPWETTSRNGTAGHFLFVGSMLPMIASRAGAEAAESLRAQMRGENTLLLARDADSVPYLFHCVDVRDVVQGLLLMLEHPAAVGEAFNLSGPSPFSYDQAIPYLAQKTGFPVVDACLPGPTLRIHHSTAKARGLLGYAPKYDIFSSIDDGIADKSR